MEKAIIGGTGVYDIAENVSLKTVNTEYGDVIVEILRINGEDIVFLPRHGKNHSVPPHLINYRANMKALKDLGVKYIYATVTVGSCSNKFNVGDIVVIKDFIDFTKSRLNTYFDGGNMGVAHVDMSEPYCSYLIIKFYSLAKELNIPIKGEAVYVCTEGPRFETASEIKMYKMLGGDVVGMTNVPEVNLAKELGMCYCAIGLVSNLCTGIDNVNLAQDNIGEKVIRIKEEVVNVFIKAFKNELTQDFCQCSNSIMKL